jgi:hypothetical protein
VLDEFVKRTPKRLYYRNRHGQVHSAGLSATGSRTTSRAPITHKANIPTGIITRRRLLMATVMVDQAKPTRELGAYSETAVSGDNARVETGPMKFGDNWGIFIRADGALGYVETLRSLMLIAGPTRCPPTSSRRGCGSTGLRRC